jgi:methionyl-tRNA formyltransferase
VKVLVLGDPDIVLTTLLAGRGSKIHRTQHAVSIAGVMGPCYDFIVSYRYRHIIPSAIISLFPDRILNLHISLLPWNRGADPNLWSFLEDTVKGVTIHYVDAGLDTGDILVNKELSFGSLGGQTLATTYEVLNRQLLELFGQIWPELVKGNAPKHPQPRGGSYHRSADKYPYVHLLHRGWDTPVAELVGRALKTGGAGR